MRFSEHQGAARFLEVAGAWLEEREALMGLPLGLALRTLEDSHPMDAGTRFFTVRRGEEVLTAALQTPKRPVILTGGDPGAIELLAVELPKCLDRLVGCNGPVEASDLVAERWREGGFGRPRVHADLRLFQLTEVTAPRLASGRMRRAEDGDYGLARHWLHRFLIDCNLPEANQDVVPEAVPALDQGRMYVWEVAGTPVACAAWSRPVKGGVCIGYVYTPDDRRGRGYASNLVASLSRALLRGELDLEPRAYVTLFTDLANPTSNSIYQKIGYRPLADFRHYQLLDQDS